MLVPGCQHVPPRPLSAPEEARRFEARSLDSEALREFLGQRLGVPVPSWPLPRWDARSLTAAAFFFQPALDGARARVDGARAAIRTAGARPNPTLSVTPEFVTNPETGLAPWVAATQLDWPIETAGKRRYRIQQAQESALAAREAFATRTWDVRHAVVTTLVELAAARRRVTLLEQSTALQEQLAGRMEARVNRGVASEVELAPLRLAALQSQRELAAARTEQARLVPALAASIGVPAQQLAPREIRDPPPPEADPLAALTRGEALRGALLGRSDIRAALARYAAAEAALRLELARQYPDLHLGTGYTFDQGENKWLLGLSLQLPLLDQNQGPIAQAEAAREEASASFTETQARVISQVEEAIARRDALAHERERLKALQAERERNVMRSRVAVSVGVADRSAELAARVEALRAARNLDDTETSLQLALADLERATEPPILPLEQIAAAPQRSIEEARP
jgi:outer membrane protein TolC